MRRFVLLAGFAAVAGCGTPQERCVSGATRDLRVVDQLIVQTQGNLDRGYALVEEMRSADRWVVCAPARPATATEPARRAEMCLQEYSFSVVEPRAVNLADQRVTLAELKKKRADLDKASWPAVASCKLSYPE